MPHANWTFQLIKYVSPLWCPKQGSNYKEGLTPVLSLLTESSRHHREVRRYIKAQVQQLRENTKSAVCHISGADVTLILKKANCNKE